MKTMLLKRLAPLAENPEPLELANLPEPEPAAGEVLIRVHACGVCHTELDEIEGRTPPPSLPVVPGHEIVGTVAARGEDARRHEIGDRVGVGWIYHSSGEQDENLSPEFRATGRDANGGYAEYMTVHERYAYPMPAQWSDTEAAPLLCAGAVGYRALMLAGIEDGQALGLMGFGGSAHLVLQLAAHLYPNSAVQVYARSETTRTFARDLGAAWAGGMESTPPEQPAAIINTTPAWSPVLAALRKLRPGGRLVINAIRKENADRAVMAGIDYADDLWMEKSLKTVANVTAADIESFLRTAAEARLHARVQTYPLEEANRALRDLKGGAVQGAKVLAIA